MKSKAEAEFMANVNTAVRILAALKKRFAEQPQAQALRARCIKPGCNGIIHATVNGRKRHVAFRCDGCNIVGME